MYKYEQGVQAPWRCSSVQLPKDRAEGRIQRLRQPSFRSRPSPRARARAPNSDRRRRFSATFRGKSSSERQETAIASAGEKLRPSRRRTQTPGVTIMVRSTAPEENSIIYYHIISQATERLRHYSPLPSSSVLLLKWITNFAS